MTHKFNTLALHAGIHTDDTLSRGVPVHRTTANLYGGTITMFSHMLPEMGIHVHMSTRTKKTTSNRPSPRPQGCCSAKPSATRPWMW